LELAFSGYPGVRGSPSELSLVLAIGEGNGYLNILGVAIMLLAAAAGVKFINEMRTGTGQRPFPLL
jgi:hypothetical protein